MCAQLTLSNKHNELQRRPTSDRTGKYYVGINLMGENVAIAALLADFPKIVIRCRYSTTRIKPNSRNSFEGFVIQSRCLGRRRSFNHVLQQTLAIYGTHKRSISISAASLD